MTLPGGGTSRKRNTVVETCHFLGLAVVTNGPNWNAIRLMPAAETRKLAAADNMRANAANR